jgi:RNA polymerase sigma-70 factor, ECF subfamily
MTHRTINISTEISDASLVAMAVSGEPKAFDALVKRFQRAVHAVAFAVIADREATLDVLQESFIAAYRQLHTLDDGNRFGPWICGIARNQAKRLRRVRNRHASRELPLPEAETAPTESQANALAERISDALATLTEMQANAVALFYMEGYTIAECAAILEVPQGTIKRRLYDARQRLKKEMTDIMKKHLREFALPEEYKVVFEKTTPIHTTSPVMLWFKNRWVLLWQDGLPWEPYDGPWWYWLSESEDGRNWSEPRRLEMPTGKDAMRNYSEGLCLMNGCVFGDRVAFLTHQFAGHMDLYTSEDTVRWTMHPRFRMGMTSRGSLFSSGSDLFLTYPSIFLGALGGYRVELLRSSDGGFNWQWLNSPFWADGEVHDCTGVVVGNRIYVAWRENMGRWTTTPVPDRAYPNWEHSVAMHNPDVFDGERVQQVSLTWSDDGGQTWAHSVGRNHWVPKSKHPDPVTVGPLDVTKPYCSRGRLNMAAFGSLLVITQSVGTEDDNAEVQVAFSRDGGQNWLEKAIYSPGMLRDVAAEFGPNGSLMIAGSSRTGNEARPWVVHSQVEL